MTLLHVIAPVARETVPSLVARLAASKGVTLHQLALDLGGSLKRLVNQDRVVLENLAAWAGLEDAQLEELLSWTGEPIGEVRMRFRGEIFVSRALRNPIVQGCPHCLRSDALSAPEDPLAAMVMRGHWQMREMVICATHGALLVPLWTAQHPTARNDLTARLTEILPKILSQDLDGPVAVPTGYDQWLEQRLDGGEDTTWLSCQSLHAATTFCRLLGGELLRVNGHDEADAQAFRHASLATGFDVVRHRPDAIRSALHDLAAEADGFLDEPQKAFGSVWKDMRDFHRDNEAFKTFADIVRAVVLEIWPIAEGAVLLGQEVSQRRLHSVRTAAMALRVTERRLRPLLVEAGVISADDPRPDSRAVFDAQAHGGALRAIGSLVTDPQMRRTVGITEAELRALEQDGVLQPRTRLPGARLRWLEADGQALVEELNALAHANPGTAKWETIQTAQANSKVSVGRIIVAIRARQIRVHALPGNTSYHGFKVCRSEFGAIE
ncbi:TniQ family protein [Paracoccus hibiscisoli]|uniref:TniQ family protein n=1 Tax=Paracoccus hibiscisoli TaxID=2023261 RepID=UPI00145DF616|nr:TniQ family protein [Paracoccus hibiscisoli]